MRDRYRLPDSLRDVMRHVAAVAIAIAATCRRKPTETSLNYSSTMQVSHPCRMLAHVCAPRLLSLTLHTYIRTHRALPPRIRSPSLPLAHVLTAGRFRVVAGQEWSGEQMDAMDVCTPYVERGLWSCEELHEESERWRWALAWGSEAARAVRLPNGELRMSEERYNDTYECLRRELYAGP